jgi:DNA polymerase-3 subunit alpha
VPGWPLLTRLAREREVLGFYFSDHPLSPYRNRIQAKGLADTARVRESRDGADVGMIGMVSAIKVISDRNGRPMAFATLEDFSGSVESLVFADLYEKYRALLAQGSVVEVRARVSVREDEDPKLVLQSVRGLAAPNPADERSIHIDLTATEGDVSLEALRDLLRRHPGESPVYFFVSGGPDGEKTQIRARRFYVQPSEELVQELKSRLGARAIRLIGGEPISAKEAVPF